MEKIAIKKRPWILLLAGVVGLAVLLEIVFSYSPFVPFHLGTVAVPPVVVFFPLLFFVCYCFGAFLFLSALQGLVIACFVLTSGLFRYFGLTHPLFFVLLVGVVGSIEFAIYKKK